MAGSAVAATVVVVVPAVLHPLVGAWTLLWPALVAVAAGLFLVGDPRGSGGPRGPGPTGRSGGRDGPEDHPAHHADGHSHPHGAGSSASHTYADGPAHGTRVGGTALATVAADYDLYFSAVVHWRWSGHVDLTVRNPVAPAVRDVVTRAAAKVARTRPRDHARTECDLAAHFAVEHAVTGTGIVVWAEHVQLHLPEEDAERLARLSDRRKDLGLHADLQETERAHARAAPTRPEDRARHTRPGDTHATGPVPPPTGAAGHGRRPWAGSWSRFGPEPGEDPEGPDVLGDPAPAEEGPGHGLTHGPPFHPDQGQEHEYVYLDPVHGMPEEPVFTGPGTGPEPGRDVDEYGYESYWWPAESVPDSAEEDVQVAILRGMVDAVPDRAARAEFAEHQLRALEKAGYTEVARRVREGF